MALGVVYFFMAKFAVPRLSGIVQSRDTAIASDVNAAEHFKNLATSANAEFDKRAANTRAQAFSVVGEASKDATALYERGIADTEADLKKHIEASEKEISIAKDKTLKELNTNISAYVNEVVEKIADIKLEKTQVEKLLKTGS